MIEIDMVNEFFVTKKYDVIPKMIKLPFFFRNKDYALDVKSKNTILQVKMLISEIININPSSFRLYIGRNRLDDNFSVSKMIIPNGEKIKVVLSTPSLLPKSVKIPHDDFTTKLQVFKKSLEFFLHSDNILASSTAKKIISFVDQYLKSSANNSISRIIKLTAQFPDMCKAAIETFKNDLDLTADDLLIFFENCTELKLVASLINYMSDKHEKEVSDFLGKISNLVNEHFFLVLENLTFSNNVSLIKDTINFIMKMKFSSIVQYIPNFIIFLNNVKINDQEYFQKVFSETKSKKKSKIKNSQELILLLMALSIKSGKSQEIYKRYSDILPICAAKLNLTRACLSTCLELTKVGIEFDWHNSSSSNDNNFHHISRTNSSGHPISNNGNPSIKDQIIENIPVEYDKSMMMKVLLKNPEFDPLISLNFAINNNFKDLWSLKSIRHNLLNLFVCELIRDGISYLQLYAECIEIANGKDKTIIASVTNYLLANITQYISSSLCEQIFHFLSMLLDLCYRQNVSSLDTPSISIFGFLLLLRDHLSFQKSGIRILKRYNKEMFNIIKRYKKNESFACQNESCRILKAALSYFLKSNSQFRDIITTKLSPINQTTNNSNNFSFENYQSLSMMMLNIISKKVTNFEIVANALLSKTRFISISLSFLPSIIGTKSVRQYFLGYLSNDKIIDNNKKLSILYYFVQNESKKKVNTLNNPSNEESSSEDEGEIKRIVENLKSIQSSDQLQIQNHNDSNNDKKIIKYVFNISQLVTFHCFRKNFFHIFESDFNFDLSVLINSKLRQLVFQIFVWMSDPRAILLIPSIDIDYICQILCQIENELFKQNLLKSIEIFDENSLKRAFCIGLSITSTTTFRNHYNKIASGNNDTIKDEEITGFGEKIDLRQSLYQIMGRFSNKVIPVLLALLSNKTINVQTAEKVSGYLADYLYRGYQISEKSACQLIGVKDDVLKVVLDNTDFFTAYLPLFMIKDIFSFNIWKYIANNRRDATLLAIIEAFQYSNVSKTAYQLFDYLHIQKNHHKTSKSYNIIALSLLFNECNEFVNNCINQLFADADNDLIKSLKNSSINELVDNPIDTFLDKEKAVDIHSAILSILPGIKSFEIFNELFPKIESLKSFRKKEIVETLNNCYASNYQFSEGFYRFLISRITDESKLYTILNCDNPMMREVAYEVLQNKENFDKSIIESLVLIGKLPCSTITQKEITCLHDVKESKTLSSKEFSSSILE
ncbi:hypothetical protein TRFO_29271 [Tritrichomonas foetus]|uniref:Ubiquitin-like domain-containing protein n=1 Tax=Tritrichomonas foetus TaxID=1144522 RepID=A0A1J4K0S7_9EUKA|nr:hypothetical protein TRFO_29271 [Tritrichomonas foetus]|eukprot:OHT03350.1 hypothetical protein TRFO_29271 [Tritrichomonas foetus]